MKKVGETYRRYCDTCKAIQEMIYRGPLVNKNNLEKMPDSNQFKDLQLYTCKKCHTSRSYHEPKEDNPVD